MASVSSSLHRLRQRPGRLLLLVVLLAFLVVATIRFLMLGKERPLHGRTCGFISSHTETTGSRQQDVIYSGWLSKKSNYQLYLRTKAAKAWGETRSFLLQSLQLFWPGANLLIVFDADDIHERKFAENIAAETEQYKPLRVQSTIVSPHKFNAGFPFFKHRRNEAGTLWSGYSRGQLDMLFADKVVKSKFVGFLDSDTVFTTLVTPRSLFSKEGKPIIIGLVGRGTQKKDINPGLRAVVDYLRKPYVMGCMSMFPVTVYTAHLSALRRHIEKLHQRTFIDVYSAVWANTTWHCHFTLLCNYVWYYHRHDYEFRYQSQLKWSSGWRSQHASGETKDFSFLTAENTRSIARVSFHGAYADFLDTTYLQPPLTNTNTYHLGNSFQPKGIGRVLIYGYCFVATAVCSSKTRCKRIHQACQRIGFQSDRLFVPLFRFEGSSIDWQWEPNVCLAQHDHVRTLYGGEQWLKHAQRVLSVNQPELWRLLNITTQG